MGWWRWLKWEVAAVLRAARGAVSGPGPERDAAVQSLKAAAAAALAWAVTGWWWGAPMALMAPWTAVVLVESTVYRSVRSGLQQLAVIAAGTVIAAGAAMLTGNKMGAMVLALPLTVLLGNYARFGQQGMYASTTALFVLAYGSYSLYDIGHRLLESVIGAAIGITVNALVFPPVHARSVRHMLYTLPRDSADLLHTIAQALREAGDEGYSREDAESWQDRARRLANAVTDLHTARGWDQESYRLNPGYRLRRRGSAAPPADWDETWDGISEHLKTLTRTLREAAPDQNDLAPPPPGALGLAADVLDAAGNVCEHDLHLLDEGPEEEREGRRAADLDRAWEAHGRLKEWLSNLDGEASASLGGLTAEMQRLLYALGPQFPLRSRAA
ncbi:FUSC family protein [Streptomyces purpurogeneiscleroticus]|uniref:FUSC family protein n=1 Tax=Streptomyces purpurogeneiscleroticus TaxID=68259 RepID=UPI001CBA9D7A|nr:aromatic acid exporter family protein [Streptomyces purpurogeneiscleroticus]MBZ4015303.1 hypothetical protein [Streptomyces purpurogeneiscleroticus]